MKSALIAERPEVQLQGFQLDAELIWYIFDIENGEVGLAGFGAQAGEFRHLHADGVIAFAHRIRKGLQVLGGLGRHTIFSISLVAPNSTVDASEKLPLPLGEGWGEGVKRLHKIKHTGFKFFDDMWLRPTYNVDGDLRG